LRDAAIKAQAAAIVEMAEATKRKANILEDQNVLMLFIAPKTGIISEEAREYLQLYCTIELSKLHEKVIEEEEFKKQQSVHEKHSITGTSGGGAIACLKHEDQVRSPVKSRARRRAPNRGRRAQRPGNGPRSNSATVAHAG
jgi:hypothetical protein